MTIMRKYRCFYRYIQYDVSLDNISNLILLIKLTQFLLHRYLKKLHFVYYNISTLDNNRQIYKSRTDNGDMLDNGDTPIS